MTRPVGASPTARGAVRKATRQATGAATDPYACRPGGLKRMCDKDFQRISDFVKVNCGIKLPPSKKTMIEARLQKRLRELGMTDYKDYCAFVFSDAGEERELIHLVDSVTTNTTDFFREPKHFEFLFNELLPDWLARTGGRRQFSIWSAACSSGEEPYTMAMVLAEFAQNNPSFNFSILATDISTRVLQFAKRAVYPEDKVRTVPQAFKKKYLLRSRDRSKKQVRIAPEVRRLVGFRQLNFMEPFSFREPMDVVFCRNALIYFERPTQEMIVGKLAATLGPGGHLFIGHSESLSGMNLPLRQVAPTIYIKV